MLAMIFSAEAIFAFESFSFSRSDENDYDSDNEPAWGSFGPGCRGVMDAGWVRRRARKAPDGSGTQKNGAVRE
jgi:hypothetical protein